MKYLLEKETHHKNEDITLKKQNKIFLKIEYSHISFMFVCRRRKLKKNIILEQIAP